MPDAFNAEHIKTLRLMAFALKPHAADAVNAALARADEIDRLEAEAAQLREVARRAVDDAEALADAVACLDRIGQMVGVGQADWGGDDRQRLVREVRDAFGRLEAERDAMREAARGRPVNGRPLFRWLDDEWLTGCSTEDGPPPSVDTLGSILGPYFRSLRAALAQAEAGAPAPPVAPPRPVYCPSCLGPTTPMAGGYWCDICRAIVGAETPPPDDRPACPVCGGPTEDRGCGVWCAGMCGKLAVCCDGGAMEPGGRVGP